MCERSHGSNNCFTEVTSRSNSLQGRAIFLFGGGRIDAANKFRDLTDYALKPLLTCEAVSNEPFKDQIVIGQCGFLGYTGNVGISALAILRHHPIFRTLGGRLLSKAVRTPYATARIVSLKVRASYVSPMLPDVYIEQKPGDTPTWIETASYPGPLTIGLIPTLTGESNIENKTEARFYSTESGILRGTMAASTIDGTIEINVPCSITENYSRFRPINEPLFRLLISCSGHEDQHGFPPARSTSQVRCEMDYIVEVGSPYINVNDFPTLKLPFMITIHEQVGAVIITDRTNKLAWDWVSHPNFRYQLRVANCGNGMCMTIHAYVRNAIYGPPPPPDVESSFEIV